MLKQVRPSRRRQRPAASSARRCTARCSTGRGRHRRRGTGRRGAGRARGRPRPVGARAAAARLGAPAGPRAPGRRARARSTRPSGGTWEPDGGWTAFRSLLGRAARRGPGVARPAAADQRGRPRRGAVRRSPARRRVRGCPSGSTRSGRRGGLNLLADRFAYVDARRHAFGSSGVSACVLDPAWQGRSARPWPTRRSSSGSAPTSARRLVHDRGPAGADGVRLARPAAPARAAARRAAARRGAAREVRPPGRRRSFVEALELADGHDDGALALGDVAVPHRRRPGRRDRAARRARRGGEPDGRLRAPRPSRPGGADGDHEFLVRARRLARRRGHRVLGTSRRARAAHHVGAGQAAGVTFVTR